jgi:hypothetical protein
MAKKKKWNIFTGPLNAFEEMRFKNYFDISKNPIVLTQIENERLKKQMEKYGSKK